eukprot:TRINITY_DN65585_c0_g1_i1.p1 TRINITY_DN65585_c0_g1~~TRINITY_DN65585_c0_g1_i1.p1  ORF type:complete len:171 (+),score=32.42 TRINITY_DN65585_c0_g1_i1:36-515(+)
MAPSKASICIVHGHAKIYVHDASLVGQVFKQISTPLPPADANDLTGSTNTSVRKVLDAAAACWPNRRIKSLRDVIHHGKACLDAQQMKFLREINMVNSWFKHMSVQEINKRTFDVVSQLACHANEDDISTKASDCVDVPSSDGGRQSWLLRGQVLGHGV